MKFKTVAKHYIGCEVFDSFNDEYLKLSARALQGYLDGLSEDEPMQIKPILRRLEDMTEEDMKDLINIEEIRKRPFKYICLEGTGITWKTEGTEWEIITWLDELSPLQFTFLLSRSYDLFSLIDSGQAIDRKLKQG